MTGRPKVSDWNGGEKAVTPEAVLAALAR